MNSLTPNAEYVADSNALSYITCSSQRVALAPNPRDSDSNHLAHVSYTAAAIGAQWTGELLADKPVEIQRNTASANPAPSTKTAPPLDQAA
jgi:hypothetical protein